MEFKKNKSFFIRLYHSYRLEFCIFVVAFMIRIALVVFVAGYEMKIGGLDNFDDTNFPIVGGDSHEYYVLANNLINNQAFSLSSEAPFYPESFRTPGYPIFLAIILKIFGSLSAVIIIQAILAGISAILVFRLALMFVARRYAALSAWLFVFEPFSLYFSILVFSESLFVFLTLLALYFFININNIQRVKVRFIALGMILGFAVLVRVIGIFTPMILIFFGYFFLKKEWPAKKILVAFLFLLIGFTAVVAPWSLRNKKIFNSYLLSSVSAYNSATYHIPRFYAYKFNSDPKQIGREIFSIAGGNVLSENQYRSLSNVSNINSIADKYLSGNRLNYYWFFASRSLSIYITNGWQDLAEYMKFHPAKAASIGRIFWIIIDLAIITEVLSITLSKNQSGWTVCLLMILMLLFYFMLAPGPEAGARLRIPAEPLMFILAAVGIERIFNLIYARK